MVLNRPNKGAVHDVYCRDIEHTTRVAGGEDLGKGLVCHTAAALSQRNKQPENHVGILSYYPDVTNDADVDYESLLQNLNLFQ